jgi:dihydrofolate reductase
MRKIINSAFVSLDGVTADPRSWAIFDSDSAEEAVQALQAFDGMLMGRGTYEYFAEVMPNQTGPYADALNAMRTYVFSSTLGTPTGTTPRSSVTMSSTPRPSSSSRVGLTSSCTDMADSAKRCSRTTSSTKSGSPFTQC